MTSIPGYLSVLLLVMSVNSQKRLPDGTLADDSSSSGSFPNGGRFGGSASSNGRKVSGSTGDNNGDLFAPNEANFKRLTTQRSQSSRRTTDPFGGDSSSSGNFDQDSDFNSNSGSGVSSGSGSRGNSNSFGSGNSDADTSDLIGNGNSGFGSNNSGNGSRRNTIGDKITRTTRRSTFEHDSDLGDSSFGSNSGSRGRDAASPSDYRIEVEILRLENKGGTLQDGKAACDVLSTCDPKLYADITTDSNSAWPKPAVYNKWPVIFSVNNNNSPPIYKVINRDVCGASKSWSQSVQATTQIRVVDMEAVTQEDDISKFSCAFSFAPRDIGTDPLSTPWGDIRECTGDDKGQKIKLNARARAFKISSTECNSQRVIAGVDGPKP